MFSDPDPGNHVSTLAHQEGGLGGHSYPKCHLVDANEIPCSCCRQQLSRPLGQSLRWQILQQRVSLPGLGPGGCQVSCLPDSCLVLQRACYLSINPQKDETLETEKAQYYLPDGSTIEVGDRTCVLRPPKLWACTELFVGRQSQVCLSVSPPGAVSL